MTKISSLQAFVRRFERSAAQFSVAVRTLHKAVLPLAKDYRMNITRDGPTCVMADLVNADGFEAGLSLDFDFSRMGIRVHLLVDRPNGDKRVLRVRGADPLRKGIRELQALLSLRTKAFANVPKLQKR